MDIPQVVENSNLYSRLRGDIELLTAIHSLRSVAGTLADTVSRTVPTFTDHTVRHMDALWGVADRVLTASEVTSLSHGEAFLLACSFYLHDIGMAYAATEEGLRQIQSSSAYTSFMASTPSSLHGDASFQGLAFAYAVRALHANAAIELATKPVPGTDVYLFDSRPIREAWASTCGRIAASHHWSLEMVEREIGSQGTVPLPGGLKGDLGYIASILRLTDYAHINRDRANKIERAFRQPIEQDSLIHWLAQEHIDGPERDGADLVYRSAVPIDNVDAWWLYYEMLQGLDEEIRMVRRYLDRRASSQGRLSLQGVRGVTSPEEAAVFIPTAGFLPIEINLRTGSIERLVQLLAGESLYGPNPMPAVRELIQNSRDAVMLKAAIASTDFDRAALSIPIRIELRTTGSAPQLKVADPGVGMTRKVMTNYLISIASDYWTSQFHSDFPGARGRGFQPAGKFGIGFLSVFMLGDEVNVESNRDGGERYRLHLRGIGRRGDMRTVASPSGSGTSVQVELRNSVVDLIRPLDELVRAYAPMLSHSIEVDVDGQVTSIPVGWLQELDAKEFYSWILQAIDTLLPDRRGSAQFYSELDHALFRRHYRIMRGGREQEFSWSKEWPQFQEGGVRLLAAFEGSSILSIMGLSIQPIATPGFVGIIDLETAITDVSRRSVITADITDVLDRAKVAIRPQIVENLNTLASEGLLINKLSFLTDCVALYGRQTILESSIPWIGLLKLPGEVRLINCAELLEKLNKSVSLFISFGGEGPWTAMKRWVALDPQPDLAICLDTPVRYRTGIEEEVGRLSDLWPECKNRPLTGTILRLAAEAWQISLEDLVNQEEWHYKTSSLWGRLSRP